LSDYCCGDVECFGLWKRVPNSLGPPSVCLHHLIGFCRIFLVGVKQHLSNFLSLYCKVNGDISIPSWALYAVRSFSVLSTRKLLAVVGMGMA
jgi:hypothetical protein